MISATSLVERPIFIMGPGRSGTTLVRSLLSAHSQICITPETHFMNRAEGNALEHGTPPDFEDFWNGYTSWVRFQDLGVEADFCRELIEHQGDYSYKSIFRAVLTAYRENAGVKRVGEKTPGHTRYLDYLLKWFPEASVIVTQRDPRAVVASQLGTPWVQQRLKPFSLREGIIIGKRVREVAFYADQWTEIFEERLGPWRHDQRVYIVRYEDLVNDVESELRAICDFLGEPFEAAMLTNRTHATVPMPAGETSNEELEEWRRQHHKRSLAPVSKDSLDKWRNELTTMEVAMIEGQCIHMMRRAGYSPSQSPSRRLTGRTMARFLLVAEDVERKVRWITGALRRRVTNIIQRT